MKFNCYVKLLGDEKKTAIIVIVTHVVHYYVRPSPIVKAQGPTSTFTSL